MRKGYAAIATLAVIGFVAVSTLYLTSNNTRSGMNLMSADSEVDMKFINYIGQYQKSYQSKEEFLQRMEIFARNAAIIAEHNSGDASYSMGVNKFTDMTEEELRARLGLADRKHIHRKIDGDNSFIIFNTTNLPTSVDWRPTGAVTPVIDQGSCGSCYAISAVGAIEGAYWKLTNQSTAFSVQQIVDCADGSYQNQGCGGGLPDWVFDYVWDNGLETNASYPYTGHNGYCGDEPSEYAVTLTHYYDVTHENPDQLKGAVNQVGPISIGVGAGNYAWFNYNGGIVDDAIVCKPNLDHAVLLVGYGTENGKDYWIVKNSWGSDWGENGFIRILISSGFGVCGVNMTPLFPVVKKI